MQWVQWEPRQCHRCRCISLGCRAHAAGGPGTAGVPRACRGRAAGARFLVLEARVVQRVQLEPQLCSPCSESGGPAERAAVVQRDPGSCRGLPVSFGRATGASV